MNDTSKTTTDLLAERLTRAILVHVKEWQDPVAGEKQTYDAIYSILYGHFEAEAVIRRMSQEIFSRAYQL